MYVYVCSPVQSSPVQSSGVATPGHRPGQLRFWPRVISQAQSASFEHVGRSVPTSGQVGLPGSPGYGFQVAVEVKLVNKVCLVT